MTLIAAAVFALYAAWMTRALVLARASASWPSTAGRVLSAVVDESTDTDGDTTHSAHVRYWYMVDGRRYDSRRLSYRPTTGLAFSTAADMLAGVTRGREVTVYYDPAHPERAVLIPGSSAANAWHIAVALVALAFALWDGWR